MAVNELEMEKLETIERELLEVKRVDEKLRYFLFLRFNSPFLAIDKLGFFFNIGKVKGFELRFFFN